VAIVARRGVCDGNAVEFAVAELKRLEVRRGETIELILDDTHFAKRGRKMDDLSWTAPPTISKN
jgi:hypothetical protein